MLTISFPKHEVEKLKTEGVTARINMHPTKVVQQVHHDKGYLCYTDAQGKANRCQIITAGEGDDGLVRFFCKSHGEDKEEHVVFTPGGTVKG